MSAGHLLRHSRKLQSLRNIVDCERPGIAHFFSTGPGSFAVKENGVDKLIGGARFSQYKQPGNNLETCKVSVGGQNGSSTCRGTLANCINSGVYGLNGSLSRNGASTKRQLFWGSDCCCSGSLPYQRCCLLLHNIGHHHDSFPVKHHQGLCDHRARLIAGFDGLVHAFFYEGENLQVTVGCFDCAFGKKLEEKSSWPTS